MDEHGQHLSLLGLAAEDAGQRIKELKEAHGDLREANSKLGVKVIDLEGLSLWKNLQILDLAESTQSGRPTDFFVAALCEIFGGDVFTSPPEIDRAHRTLVPKLKPGDQPRPVILHFHVFQTK